MKTLSKLIIGIAISLSVSRYAQSADLGMQTLRDFTCGLQTSKDASLIGDNCSPDLVNVDVWTGSIKPRRGSVIQNSTQVGDGSAVRFLHEFSDSNGVFWLISVSSNSIYASSNGGVTNTLLTSTHGVTNLSQFSAANAYGYARLTDGTTNWILTDGTTLSVSTAAPKGKTAAFYYERLWTSIGSVLYASRFGNLEDWTEDADTDNEAFSENIRFNDGYDITALVEFKGVLYVFKDYSIDSLTTSDGLTFTRTPVSNTVGTKYSKSIQVRDNDLIFLGPDDFYSFNGVSLTPIGRDITPTISAIKQLQAQELSLTLNTESDFSTGLSTYTSTSISGGSVVLSTYSTSETTFGGAGASYDSNYISAGDNLTVIDTAKTLASGTTVTISAGAPVSTQFYQPESSSDVRVLFIAGLTAQYGEYIYYLSNPISTGSWSFTFSCTDCVGISSVLETILFSLSTAVPTGFSSASYNVRLRMDASSSTVSIYRDNSVLISSVSVSATFAEAEKLWTINRNNAGTISVYVDGTLLLSGTDTTYNTFPYLYFAYDGTGATAIATRSTMMDWNTLKYIPANLEYVSPTIDFGHANVKYLTQAQNYTTSVGSITYTVYSDTDTSISTGTVSTFVSSQTLTSNYFSTSAARYLRHKIGFNGVLSGLTNTSINSVSYTGVASTGTYVSTGIGPLSGISSFGVLEIDNTLGSGSISYAVYSDSNNVIDTNNLTTFIASQTITSGISPTISIGTYVFVKASLSVNSSSVTAPSMDRIDLFYNVGSVFPPYAISYEGEYLCSVAIDAATYNDTILVYDRNNKWVKYSGLNAYSFSPYKQQPYFGSALTGYIAKFQVDGVYADSGVGINSYWTSKEFDFGYPVSDKSVIRYYVTGERFAFGDASFSYGVNRGSLTSTVLDLDITSGFFRQVIKPTSTTYNRGITHRFRVSNAEEHETFSIHSITIAPRLEENP